MLSYAGLCDLPPSPIAALQEPGRGGRRRRADLGRGPVKQRVFHYMIDIRICQYYNTIIINIHIYIYRERERDRER